MTPCMPCSFGLLPHPRSGSRSPAQRSSRVTVTVRYIPLVTAAYGTRVARNDDARTWRRGSQLTLRVRPVRGDVPPHGKSPKGSRQPVAATAGRVTVRDASSVGDWFPDEFGNVDHEVG